ncbi:alpha/beta fold hydrolase [Sphingomonas mali]|uniref:alpha/beta fold hydrolase n=1 Tax=Sphingomonas mali TaxID=40682 RepID=UPI00083780FB|nr:alpha/beta hydrolase [Sphingomonas mali]
MPFARRGQSRFYYELTGDGPPLVLSHGVGGNHASWYLQVAALAERFRIVTWDHRGFGLSSDVEGQGRAGFVDDLIAVLDAAEIDRAVLVGQSMGGGTCLAMTCTHPDRVSGLVMADSLAQAILPPEVADRFAANGAATAGLTQIERVLGATIRRENPTAATLYSQIAGFNAITLRTLHGNMPSYSAEALAASGVPSLFIVGDEDILFPPWAVRAFQAGVPDSRYVELSRTGHSAFYERPDAFNAVLESWLFDIGYAPSNSR